jgi:hypothetical protein
MKLKALAYRALFIVLFVPLHSFLSVLLLQRAYNPPAGGTSVLFHALLVTITGPVLLPLVLFDPDGDRLPRWLQVLSVPFNSLVWAAGLLLLVALVQKWRGAAKPAVP